MGCIVKTLGRLLFITLLVSSAYIHLTKPQNSVEELSTNYSEVFECAGKYIPGILPPASIINWQLVSKILGLFEGLTAILIVFGDCWGGFFLFTNLLVSGYFDYKDIQSICQWEVSRQLEFARYVLFVGASIAFMACTKPCKKSCQKAKN